jgi:hypothetical protein
MLVEEGKALFFGAKFAGNIYQIHRLFSSLDTLSSISRVSCNSVSSCKDASCRFSGDARAEDKMGRKRISRRCSTMSVVSNSALVWRRIFSMNRI